MLHHYLRNEITIECEQPVLGFRSSTICPGLHGEIRRGPVINVGHSEPGVQGLIPCRLWWSAPGQGIFQKQVLVILPTVPE